MWTYVRGSSTTKLLLIFHEFRYLQAMFIFTFSAGVTPATIMAWSIAWLHLDWYVLMEYFLKWCAETLHHYFSKHVSTKSWPYKSANKMPCIRQCVYILFFVLGKIYSFWKNCFAAPACYFWPGHPNSEHLQNFLVVAFRKPVVNSLS